MNENEIHLRDYIRIIRKRRFTVYTFFLITFITVFIGTFTATPVFQATSKLLIEKSDLNPLLNGYPVHFDPEFLETQFQIIKSTSVARKVVRILSLDTTYRNYFSKDDSGFPLLGSIMDWFSNFSSVALAVMNINESSTTEDEKTEYNEENTITNELALMISSGIIVKPVMNSRIVNIGFASQNPELAKLIVNTVAKAYIEEILEMKMDISGYSITWMTKKAEEEKEKLEKSEKALQSYIKATDIVTIEDRVAIIPQRLSELSTRLTRAEAERKELETLFNKIKDVTVDEAEAVPVIALDKTLQAIRGQILKADQNITELSKKYGEKHPAMKRARSDLQVLGDKKEQEILRLIRSIQADYELAISNEENLSDTLTRTKTDAVDLNEKFIQYGILKRDVDTNRNIFNALITKIKEQSITEKIQNVNVWIVDTADTPTFPTKPRKKRNILLGVILGLFGGIGLAFFIEYLDNTIKSPAEAEEKLGTPVLGIVPFMKSRNVKIEQIVKNEPKSEITEAYRTIRTSVLLSSADHPPKKVLITSMTSGDGKTTTAINLAIAIAQTGRNVLLIDNDLRRPRLHKLFDLDNTKGLSTFLAGISDLDVLKHSPMQNLTIIPSGPLPPTPSELFNSKKMNELLEKVDADYDNIIFDSPPVLPVTDSLILSKIVDGTLIVTRSGQTTYEIAQRGLKFLKDIDSNILGMVINAVDLKKNSYDYFGYYGYYSSDDDT